MEQAKLPNFDDRQPSQQSADFEESQEQRGQTRGKSERSRIPDPDQIMQMLMQLNGLVTLGVISTAKANVLHRNLRTILDVQLQRTRGDDTGPSPEGLVDLCRQNPKLLNLLEGFLSDQQLNWLADALKEEGDD